MALACAEALRAGLVAEDVETRNAAALEIGTRRLREAASAVVARLGHEPAPTVRETLTWACVQLGSAVHDDVVALLTSAEPSVRMQAAHVLSKMDLPIPVEALSPVIADRDEDVSVKAFRAASSTHDPAVVPMLARRLGSGSSEVRDALTTAFAELGPLGVAELVEALDDDDPAVIEHTLEAIAQVGSPDADGVAAHVGAMLGESDVAVQVAAVMALGALDRDVTGPMLEFAATLPEPRVAATALRLLEN